MPSTSRGTSTTPSTGKNLSPTGGGEPDGDLKAAIDQDFGSFEAFQKQLNESAKGIQGFGGQFLPTSRSAGSCSPSRSTITSPTCRSVLCRC